MPGILASADVDLQKVKKYLSASLCGWDEIILTFSRKDANMNNKRVLPIDG